AFASRSGGTLCRISAAKASRTSLVSIFVDAWSAIDCENPASNADCLLDLPASLPSRYACFFGGRLAARMGTKETRRIANTNVLSISTSHVRTRNAWTKPFIIAGTCATAFASSRFRRAKDVPDLTKGKVIEAHPKVPSEPSVPTFFHDVK